MKYQSIRLVLALSSIILLITVNIYLQRTSALADSTTRVDPIIIELRDNKCDYLFRTLLPLNVDLTTNTPDSATNLHGTIVDIKYYSANTENSANLLAIIEDGGPPSKPIVPILTNGDDKATLTDISQRAFNLLKPSHWIAAVKMSAEYTSGVLNLKLVDAHVQNDASISNPDQLNAAIHNITRPLGTLDLSDIQIPINKDGILHVAVAPHFGTSKIYLVLSPNDNSISVDSPIIGADQRLETPLDNLASVSIEVPYSLINYVAAKYGNSITIPINNGGDQLLLHNIIATGSDDNLVMKGKLDHSNPNATFDVIANWTGADLRLNRIAVFAPDLHCGKFDFACIAAQKTLSTFASLESDKETQAHKGDQIRPFGGATMQNITLLSKSYSLRANLTAMRAGQPGVYIEGDIRLERGLQ